MAKINIFYSTINRSQHIIRYGEFFKWELLKLSDVKLYLVEEDAHIDDLIKKFNVIPDLIFFDDFTKNKTMYGLEQVDIPKGVLYWDVHTTQNEFRAFVWKNRIDLIFSFYRDAFSEFFPEFAERLGYRRIGLAFCVGLREEARIFMQILESNGFESQSAICKTGSVNKKLLGVVNQVNPEAFEAMCNPIAQAALLDEAGCQLHVILGLCVGHDTLFIKHAKAPVTVLAVKDRVLAHNPLGALYAGHYYQKKLKGIINKQDR